MSEKEEIKTASSILHEYGINIMEMNDDFNCQLLTAMERYAEQKSFALQLEVERLKKEKEESDFLIKSQAEIIRMYSDVEDNLKAEIERLRSNEGVRELLRKQREICQRIYDAEKSGLIDAVIGNVFANAPEPSFEPVAEEKKEDDNKDCEHINTKHRQIRCDVCTDCGYVVEIDV
jgi:predicted transcriptional regulator